MGEITFLQFESNIVSLPDWLPISIFEVGFELSRHPAIKDLTNLKFEIWERYIRRAQNGESWHVKNCLVLDKFKLSVEQHKTELVDSEVTLIRATWGQDLITLTISDNRHLGLYKRSVPQPGPWEYFEELNSDFQSNGIWPYDDIEWKTWEWH